MKTRQGQVLACTLAVLVLATWLQWRAWRRTVAAHDSARVRLAAMRSDAAEIERLRNAPKAAVSHVRKSEDLLAQIEAAMQSVGLDRKLWRDSIPQPPMRVPKSDYQIQATRLYFDGMTLRQLAKLAVDLVGADPTLRITSVDLASRDAESPEYDVDLTVAYWVYAPQAG